MQYPESRVGEITMYVRKERQTKDNTVMLPGRSFVETECQYEVEPDVGYCVSEILDA